MKKFLDLVEAEHLKQINKHGYTPEHDDGYIDGSIADAAACYAATTPIFKFRLDDKKSRIPMVNVYPFSFVYFTKDKHTRKEQIIISAAMLMAEYERLEREEKKFEGNIPND